MKFSACIPSSRAVTSASTDELRDRRGRWRMERGSARSPGYSAPLRARRFPPLRIQALGKAVGALEVDPLLAHGGSGVGMCQHDGMSRVITEVIQDGVGADAISNPLGAGGNRQYLAECPDGLSGDESRCITTGVSYHDNPYRIAPAGVIVGREETFDTQGDVRGGIVRRYDHANGFDPSQGDGRRRIPLHCR